MKISVATVVVGSVILLTAADFLPSTPIGIIGSAQAVVGRPASPVSYAGVARRTTRRTVAVTTSAATTAAATSSAAASEAAAASASASAAAASASQSAAAANASAAQAGGPPVGTVVGSLPQGCVPTPVGGVEYEVCNGTYFRASFEGNNLVYVVVPRP